MAMKPHVVLGRIERQVDQLNAFGIRRNDDAVLSYADRLRELCREMRTAFALLQQQQLEAQLVASVATIAPSRRERQRCEKTGGEL